MDMLYRVIIPGEEMDEADRAAMQKSSGNVSGYEVLEEELVAAARRIAPNAKVEFYGLTEEQGGYGVF